MTSCWFGALDFLRIWIWGKGLYLKPWDTFWGLRTAENFFALKLCKYLGGKKAMMTWKSIVSYIFPSRGGRCNKVWISMTQWQRGNTEGWAKVYLKRHSELRNCSPGLIFWANCTCLSSGGSPLLLFGLSFPVFLRGVAQLSATFVFTFVSYVCLPEFKVLCLTVFWLSPGHLALSSKCFRFPQLSFTCASQYFLEGSRSFFYIALSVSAILWCLWCWFWKRFLDGSMVLSIVV